MQYIQALANRKKLFLIINRLVLGGHSADAVSLAHHLATKYDITILYGEKETEEIEVPLFIQKYPDISFLKISSLHRSIHPFNDAIAYRQMYSVIKKNRPDIVHTHGFKSGFLGRIAAKRANVPVIIHTYHGHLFHSYYNRFISSFIIRAERWLARLSTRIIAISPQQAYELSKVYPIAPPDKINIIFLGIGKENYESIVSPSSFSLRKEYNVPDNVVLIAIIGRLVTIKNFSFFIRIAKKMLQYETQVYFFIIGDGYEKQAIQKELMQQHISWREGTAFHKNAPVIFTSWITNIASALRDIDIVISTSLNEGTPVSLIEAQLFNKPVVATNVGGVRDTVLNNETGFLVDGFDVDEFVKKLQQLIHDKNLRNSMGSKGKVFVTERFSKQKEVAAIDKLYTDCLHKKKS